MRALRIVVAVVMIAFIPRRDSFIDQRMYISIYLSIYASTDLSIYHPCTHVCMYVCIYLSIYHPCIYVYMYVAIYLSIYLSIYYIHHSAPRWLHRPTPYICIYLSIIGIIPRRDGFIDQRLKQILPRCVPKAA